MERYALRRTEGTPGFVAAGLVAVGLTAVYAGGGALWPGDLAGSDSSPRQIIGMTLMLIGTTTYLLVAWTIGHRRSLELVTALRPRLPDPAEADVAAESIGSAWRRTWWIGCIIGFVLSLFNTNPIHAFMEAPHPRIAGPISLGQILLWLTIGNLIAARMATANAFARLGAVVPIDLFRLETLRPLARNGVVDAAIVMGALLFAPLQSLDAEFRWENYRFAAAVALPSLAYFVIWPLRTVHRRIRADRTARLAQVDAQLATLDAGPPSTLIETERLEQLLAHRDRLMVARTWPLDLRLLTRVFFYVIIPPLAWVAAAVVELFVDRALVGP
jgi:hypothetical protein